MNYNFPIITHIDNVLPAIDGRDEFIVSPRDGYTVINYNVGFEDTFTIDENDVMTGPQSTVFPKGVMRRECRGLIFHSNGKIMSRPFHKFFNVGEREETLLHNVNMFSQHTVMEKMDGSMIRPMWYDQEGTGEFGLALGTKMGITDTAVAAHKIATQAQLQWLEILTRQGLTPLLEFVSPDNRIVIEYDEPKLVLLAIRDNIYGRYLDIEEYRNNGIFDVVPVYGAVEGSFEDYIERQRGKEGREGDIICFADGHMLKIKNDWYVRIHKVKDKIRTDRHILALLLENELDDVYPHLDENDFNRVKKYEADFHKAFKKAVFNTMADARGAWSDAEYDKKVLATEVLPNSDIPKADWQFVFKHADGQDDFNELVMKRVRSKLGNTAKYNELAEWLGIAADQGEDE